MSEYSRTFLINKENERKDLLTKQLYSTNILIDSLFIKLLIFDKVTKMSKENLNGSFILKINKLGQITIPVEIRKELNLDAKSIVIATVSEGTIEISPAQVIPKSRTLARNPELQRTLAKVYERGSSGIALSINKLKSEIDKS